MIEPASYGASFFQTDPVAESDPLSRAVVFLEMLAPNFETAGVDVRIATGSGVVWFDEARGIYFLITAWHNLSGKEPASGLAKIHGGPLPWRVRLRGFSFDHVQALRTGDGNPDTNPPAYWMHPRGKKCDVAVLPLSGVRECHCNFSILYAGPSPQVRVAEPVFVIGYPLGLVNSIDPKHAFPIWKIGNIANDPGLDFNGEPRFLIDATTLPGMSGSPVIRRYDYAGSPGYRFLGIYVGRYVVPKKGRDGAVAYGNEPAEYSSALGWVVKPSVVYDTLKVESPPRDIEL